MKRFIFLVLFGAFLTKSVTPSIVRDYSPNLKWLFSFNNKLNENTKETKEESRTVCKTKECEKFAKELLQSMDKSVDPCDDFYKYACGKWAEHNPIPEGESSWCLFEKVQKNVEQQIEEILNTNTDENDLLAVKLAKKWYNVCMDTDAMDKQGLDPLIFTLSRIGGWPMIMHSDEWDEEEYSWQKVDDQYTRLIGRNAFHDVRVSDYGSNETEFQVHIDVPHLLFGSYRLWNGSMSGESDEDESDEDSSGEDEQSDEKKDSQEPGSEDKDDDDDDDKGDDSDNDNDDDDDDDKDDDSDNDNDDDDNDDDDNDDDDNDDDDNDDNDDDDDDDNDDDNDDEDDEINEQNDDEDAKKKATKKKSIKKTHHARNKKLDRSKKRKSDTQVTKKHNQKHNHKIKQHRVKRRTMATKENSQATHRGKLHSRKNRRNHTRKEHKKWAKKTLDNEEDGVSTTPRDSEEESDETLKAQKAYADYILNVARILVKARGIEVSQEDIKKDVEDMITFQVKLIDIVMESKGKLELTLNDFQEWYDEKNPETDHSKINWIYKIAELFDEANVAIDSDLDLKVHSADYFEALISLLDETPSRTIVNYVHWSFLSKMITTTTNEMKQLYYAWKNYGKSDDEKDEKKHKTDDKEKRSSNCIQEVEMSDILAYEYVKKHFSDNITKTAMDMVDDIQKEVEYQIKESDWMDEDTKDFVLAKLINMKKYIGYPDWYKNSTIVKRYFHGLIIGNSYYENTLSYNRYVKWKSLRKLSKVNEDDGTWWMSPITANAFFVPTENLITISAADFQSPFFAYSRPQAINYGIIGFIMAHEVNHGFDDTGHLFDKNGDFMEWLSVMSQAYGQRANCFVEQFNNYHVDPKSEAKIKNYGNQTIADNIADTMGLYTVYRAYLRRERECGKPDTVLPGLEEFTNDQLFFLSFANLWCESVDPEMIMVRAKIDEHSPGRLRIIGSVSNSEDFAKVFNCPVGSAMNPEKKCNIWK